MTSPAIRTPDQRLRVFVTSSPGHSRSLTATTSDTLGGATVNTKTVAFVLYPGMAPLTDTSHLTAP